MTDLAPEARFAELVLRSAPGGEPLPSGWPTQLAKDVLALSARLREYEETLALRNEYKCSCGNRWWMNVKPRRCPDCGTNLFNRVVLVDSENDT